MREFKWKLEETTLVRYSEHETLGITVYKPSEWLYLLTGYLPEKYHDFCDSIRWKLERLHL